MGYSLYVVESVERAKGLFAILKPKFDEFAKEHELMAVLKVGNMAYAPDDLETTVKCGYCLLLGFEVSFLDSIDHRGAFALLSVIANSTSRGGASGLVWLDRDAFGPYKNPEEQRVDVSYGPVIRFMLPRIQEKRDRWIDMIQDVRNYLNQK